MDEPVPILINHDYSQLPVGQIRLDPEIVEMLVEGRRFELAAGGVILSEEILTDGEEPMSTGRYKEVFNLVEVSLVPIQKDR